MDQRYQRAAQLRYIPGEPGIPRGVDHVAAHALQLVAHHAFRRPLIASTGESLGAAF